MRDAHWGGSLVLRGQQSAGLVDEVLSNPPQGLEVLSDLLQEPEILSDPLWGQLEFSLDLTDFLDPSQEFWWGEWNPPCAGQSGLEVLSDPSQVNNDTNQSCLLTTTLHEMNQCSPCAKVSSSVFMSAT